jgi:hypothetical protein
MASLWYDASANATLNTMAGRLNSGTIKIYTGTQPAVNVAVTGTLLATMTFGATAFAGSSASGGTATAAANSITSGTAAATGTAGYCAFVDSSSAVVFTGTVGTSGANLNLNSLSISSGALVSCSAYSITLSETGT